MNLRKTLAVAATLAGAISLAGCISVFPKAKPVQIYSFRSTTPPTAAQAPTLTVLRAPTTFPRASATDRIYTRTGNEAAYIAEARWSAPAQILFDEAMAGAFDNGAVRLATRGEAGPSDAILRVEVRTFAADYAGDGGPPTAVVEARATLIPVKNRDAALVQSFRSEKKASDNRTGPIIAAYDDAVADLLTQMVAWTTTNVKPGPKQ